MLRVYHECTVANNWITCGIMWITLLQFEKRLQKCIRMWIANSKFSFGEVYLRVQDRKSRFTAQLTRQPKTKFPTIY